LGPRSLITYLAKIPIECNYFPDNSDIPKITLGEAWRMIRALERPDVESLLAGIDEAEKDILSKRGELSG